MLNMNRQDEQQHQHVAEDIHQAGGEEIVQHVDIAS